MTSLQQQLRHIVCRIRLQHQTVTFCRVKMTKKARRNVVGFEDSAGNSADQYELDYGAKNTINSGTVNCVG